MGSVPRLSPPKTEAACCPKAAWERCIFRCKCKFSSVLWMFDLNEGYSLSEPKLCFTSYIKCLHGAALCDKICLQSPLFSLLDMLTRRLKRFWRSLIVWVSRGCILVLSASADSSAGLYLTATCGFIYHVHSAVTKTTLQATVQN